MKNYNFFKILNGRDYKRKSQMVSCILPFNKFSFCTYEVSDRFLLRKRNFMRLPPNKEIIDFDTRKISIHQALMEYVEGVKSGILDQSERKKIIHIEEKNKSYTNVDIMGIYKFLIPNTLINQIKRKLEMHSTVKEGEIKKTPIIRIFFDGGCAFKERTSFFGASIYLEEENIVKLFGNIGPKSTNNTAEYTGLIMSLVLINLVLTNNTAKPYNYKIIFYSDSELVCKQMKGTYKVNTPHILILNTIAKKLYSYIKFDKSVSHIRREFNQEADLLGNQARTSNRNSFEIYYY